MPQTFVSPAYYASGPVARPLEDRVAIAEHMAHLSGGLLVGDQVRVAWRVSQSAVVEWAELAIFVGPPSLDGASVLRPVGAVDIAPILASSQPNERHVSTITLAVACDPSSDIWLVAVAKHVENGGMIPPALVGPWWMDPLASGLVGQAIGYVQPPSTRIPLGEVTGFSPSALPRPFYAVVQVPTRCGCIEDPPPLAPHLVAP